MAASKNTDTTVHALTTAEIARLTALHSERHRQIRSERADIFSAAMKMGAQSAPMVDDDEKAARQHAKQLLNGNAPDSLSLPPDIALDKKLYREQRGIEIVLKVLADESLVAKATEAVEWAEANDNRWRALCREVTLTAIKLEALDQSARELIQQCPDIFAVNLPMGNVIGGGRAISETPIGDLTERALGAGIVTSAEIRKAQQC